MLLLIIMSFSTYVTTWGSNPLDTIQDMFNKSAINANSRVILAFASFNFSSTTYIPGLSDLTMDQVKQITNLVHQHNASISLSIGGATYPFAGSDLYSKPGDLASNINTVLNTCGFDGVDFDIEDPGASSPSDFVNNTSSLINTLRSLNNNLHITLTTAAQAWAPGMWQQPVINMTIGNLNAWQPMEYDLWVDPTTDYFNQIEYDINFYINTWSVDPNKIVMGLMPGLDDMKRNLSLQDALNLTTFAEQKGLQGVMTWDANNDSMGVDGNAPYAYSMGIISQLNKTTSSCCF